MSASTQLPYRLCLTTGLSLQASMSVKSKVLALSLSTSPFDGCLYLNLLVLLQVSRYRLCVNAVNIRLPLYIKVVTFQTYAALMASLAYFVLGEIRSWSSSGVNFINILSTAFSLVDPESVRTQTSCRSFYAFGIY